MGKGAPGCTLYTLGTSKRSLVEFNGIIRDYGIGILVDVRSFPQSRYPYFHKDALADQMKAMGVRYEPLGRELGGYRKGGYRAHMLTQAFRSGLLQVESLARVRTTALLCAERLPWRCHRRLIAAALTARGWEVVHIVDEGRVWIDEFGLRGDLFREG